MDAGDISDLLRQAVYVQQVKISLYAAKEALAEYITKPRGRKMKGLGRHYSSTERRVVRGHCQFSGLYVLLGRRCPLLPRLYRQKAVCEQEQVPFQSKIDLAVQEIEQFQPVAGTHTHVLIDSWYHCKRVRKAAQRRDWDVSGGLKSNRVMRLIAPDGSRTWLSLSDYAAQLKAEDWQEAFWPSQEGDQPVYVHAVRTWIRKLGPTQLLITCHDKDAPAKSIRYWGTTLLTADAQSVIRVLAVRWSVKVLFKDGKDLLGADQYQLMSAEAIVRFWTLVRDLDHSAHRCPDPGAKPGADVRRQVVQPRVRTAVYAHGLAVLDVSGDAAQDGRGQGDRWFDSVDRNHPFVERVGHDRHHRRPQFGRFALTRQVTQVARRQDAQPAQCPAAVKERDPAHPPSLSSLAQSVP